MYEYENFTAMLWANYTPAYINNYESYYYAGNDINLAYSKDVSSMTTFDLTMSYRLSSDIRLNFAGRNILDRDPPFTVVQGVPYDTARYNAAGRTLALEVQYEF